MQMKTIKSAKYAQESTKFNGKRNLGVTGEGLGVMGNGGNKQDKGGKKKECRGWHSFDLLGFVVLCPEGETAKAGEGYHASYGITDPAVLLGQAEALGSNQNITGADHCHEQCRDKGDKIAETIFLISDF